MFSTPGGSPASTRAFTKWYEEMGASDAGFSTTVFPATRAGNAFHAGIAIGKFHGVMSPTTPRGSLTV